MNILTVVGARPQFIKAAALSRILRQHHKEILVHTGQHYDHNMSGVFFEELSIPTPNYNLGISGGTHGKMTGEMLAEIEAVMLKEKPNMVIVYGDTNSTLAGALAAVKLHIPVCHIEAGVRMNTLVNPEEVNRVLTDRISELLCCCTQSGIESLKNEGITKGVFNTGDLMYDALIYYGKDLHTPLKGEIVDFEGNCIKLPLKYNLLTCHREENTGTDEPLFEILNAMNSLEFHTIYPVHPRNRERAQRLCLAHSFEHIILTEPVGYLTSLYLIFNANKILTDSGGLQREAWFYGKQCVTVLDHVVWEETLDGNINQMAKAEKTDILTKLHTVPDFTRRKNQFGDGKAAEKITKILTDYEKRCL